MSETIKRGPGRPPKYANEEERKSAHNAQVLKSRAKMEGKILLNEDEKNVILNEIRLLRSEIADLRHSVMKKNDKTFHLVEMKF